MKKKIQYSTELANAVEDFLKNHCWDYTYIDRYGTFQFGMRLNGAIPHLTYLIQIKADGYTVCAITPEFEDQIPDKTIAELAIFESRVNYDLHYGHFELDIHDGEIRYKTYTAYGESLPDTTVIRRSICTAAAMFEQYGKGFRDIIYEGKDAVNAFLECLRIIEKDEHRFRQEPYWWNKNEETDAGDMINKEELNMRLDKLYQRFSEGFVSISEMTSEAGKENEKPGSGKTFFRADPFAAEDDGNEKAENASEEGIVSKSCTKKKPHLKN